MKNYALYDKCDKLYTLKELLNYCAEHHGSKPAFMYQNRKNDVVVNYIQFKADVEAFGTYLFKNGYKDCHIAVIGENSYEWLLTHFAVTCGKNVIVPIDKELDAESISELLVDSDSGVLVYSDTYADIAAQLQPKLPNITYINMKDIPLILEEGNKLLTGGYTDFIDVKVGKDDLASIPYTSGTTRKSLGVMVTHNNFCSCMHAACCSVLLTGPSLLMLPLHHTFGLVANVFTLMLHGYPVYINKSLKNLLDDFKRGKPQNTFVVPLILETLYKNIWATAEKEGKAKALKLLVKISNTLLKFKIDLRKILFKSVIDAFGGSLDMILSGGAPIDVKYVRGFEAFGITILNGYGATECGPLISCNRNKFNVFGSVGPPLCCNEVKIADNGEILIKGENVMSGYYHNEEYSKNVFVDGWYKTGDIGFIDKYGALHITGRIKNLIILNNGENISAEAIEQQIYSNIPYVKEVVAYGKDNMIVAEVYLNEEEPNAKTMIHSDIQKLNQKLPQTMNIDKVLIRNTEFPKTTTKKIKRNYIEV